MPSDNRKRLTANFLSLTVIQGANFLLPLLIMPYVIYRIGAQEFGVIAVAQVVMIYLATLTDFGFYQTGTREIALNRANNNKISGIFYKILFSKALLSVFAFFILLILVFTIPIFAENRELYLLGFAYVLGQAFIATWFFQGIEKMQYLTFVSLLSRVLFVISVLIIIQNEADSKWYLFLLGMSNFVGGIISIFLAIRTCRLQFFPPRITVIIQELKNGWQLATSNLLMNSCQYINVFILRLFTNDLITGYYSIAEKIFFAIRQILSVYSQAVFPQVCQTAQEGLTSLWLFFKRYYLPFLFMVSIGCLITFFLSPQIISFFLKEDQQPSIIVLRILSVAPLIICINIPFYLSLLAFDQKSSYLKVYALGTVLNIAFCLILIKFGNEKGAAWAMVFTELVILLGLAWEFYTSIVNTKSISVSTQSTNQTNG